MSNENAILNKLTSIDESLRRLVYIAELRASAKMAAAQPKIDLDGPHGDPIVKIKDPKRWTGDSQIGNHFSECPPEYLDLIAERSDYFASTAKDDKERNYKLLDAGRARGWAARIRAGYKAPAKPDGTENMVKEDEIAF